MNSSNTLIAHIALWVVNSIYFCGLFAQLVKNYRMKSTGGLSDGMLAGYVAAYTSYIIFMFSKNFPPSCTILIPLCLLVVIAMIGQSFVYKTGDFSTRTLGMVYGSLAFFVFLAAWNFSTHSVQVGEIAGMISLFFWFIFQIPQMFKMHRGKSTEGFSFVFLVIMTLGAIVELVSSIILELPLLTLVNISRGLLFYGIFFVQFFLYARRDLVKR